MKGSGISVFSLLILLIIVMAGYIGMRVYVEYDFPVFTDEESIEDAMHSEFGAFAQFL